METHTICCPTTDEELIASLNKFQQDAAKVLYEGFKIGEQYHAKFTTVKMFGDIIKVALGQKIANAILEIDASFNSKKHQLCLGVENMPSGTQILSFYILMNEKERKYMKTRTDVIVTANCDGCKKMKPINDCLWCAGCKQVRYCSRECQKTEWKNHKPNCVKKTA